MGEQSVIRRLPILVALLATFFASTVMAQQAPDTCPVERIVPKAANDMTDRLNADLMCLWGKVQDLERELVRLKQAESGSRQVSPTAYPKESSAAVEGGVELTADGIFLSSDRKTLSANVSLKNTNDDDVLVMIVGTESKFVIQNMLIKAPIVADGIANCTPHAGNTASTWLCLADADIRWSNLSRDKIYRIHLTSTLDREVTATIADVNLHLLIKRGGKAKPYDAPLGGIEIK
jgi:hypothetical protein